MCVCVCLDICLFVCVGVSVCRCVYIMCEEWILCMFRTCQLQTSDQEQTHSMSTVGFGFSFQLVILENLRIYLEIMRRSLRPLLALKIFLKSFMPKKGTHLVKTSYIPVHTSHAKCWPFKYWFFTTLGGVVKNMGVCGCVCTYTKGQKRTLRNVCTCQERTHSMSTVGFGFSFGLVIFKNPGIDPKIMG